MTHGTADRYEVPLERGKVREFVRACGLEPTDFEDSSSSIPPTFLTTSNFWRPPEHDPFLEFGFDPARILHGEEHYAFHGAPPRVGSTLWAATRAGEKWERTGSKAGRLRFAAILTDYHDADGTLVAEQRTTVIETERVPDDAPTPPATAGGPDAVAETAAAADSRCRTFGPLTPTDFVRYQGAGGDFQAVHHDHLFALRSGLPGVFSLGMLQAGALSGVLVEWFGAAAVRSYSMRFLARCWPGDVLSCQGVRLSERCGTQARPEATVELVCRRQTGEIAIAASATVAVVPQQIAR